METLLILIDALSKMDVSNPNQWTTTGEPKVESVNLMAGFKHKFTKDEIKELAPNFTQSNPVLPTVPQVDENAQEPSAPPAPLEDSQNELAPQSEEQSDSIIPVATRTLGDDETGEQASIIVTHTALVNQLKEILGEIAKVITTDDLKEAHLAGELSFDEMTDLRNELFSAGQMLDAQLSAENHFLFNIMTNDTPNYNKNSIESIDGYIEAQKGIPREKPELVSRKTHAIDGIVN